MFILTAPVGSIVDVKLDYILWDTGTAPPVAYIVAAGTLGALYYTPLDGDSDAFVPVARVTTT